MKKILLAGIIVILAMAFAVTCDEVEPEVEYTDVVYSKDGSEVTLYIDGVGVPVTSAQRAINRELATMAYDYFEVIFISTNATGTIARTSWELGQPAGIANVPRGVDYTLNSTKMATPSNVACMFVGKKSDKTLLGIGAITSTTYTGSTTPTTPATVNTNTLSVKFSIAAIQTGLLVYGETVDPGVAGVMANSFKYVSVTGTNASASGYASIDATNSVRSNINGSPLSYPRYSLPQTDGAYVYATYEFFHIDYDGAGGGDTNDYFDAAKVYNSDAKGRPLVQKRTPRFMNGGRYMEPKEGWTTTTKVKFTGAISGTPAAGNYLPTGGISEGTSFNPLVGLEFNVKGSGVFSFYLEIPVYMLVNTSATFNGTGDSAVAPITWYIRTGVGSELYSLDDGAANGGCVFMSVGASAANWLDIEWVWL